MKLIKRTLLISLILIIIGILFRNTIYNTLITYKSIGQRPAYLAVNKKLINYIETSNSNLKNLDIKELIKVSLSKTSHHLNFTSSRNEIDPNILIDTKTAHCVGYASFYVTTFNHLAKKNNIDNSWVAKQHIGKISLFGINIHKYLNSSFFKDHDFVIIENKTTGEIFTVDPTIHDYLFINYVK